MEFNAETELTVTGKSCPWIKMAYLKNSLYENQKEIRVYNSKIHRMINC